MKAVVKSSRGEILDYAFGTSVNALAEWFNDSYYGMTGVSCSVYDYNGVPLADFVI